MGKTTLCICFLMCFGFAGAATWTVNPNGTADCNDIQAAINLAGSGDVVLVEDGIYSGDGNRDISFLGKAITVKSQSGPETCIVDGATELPIYHRGFIFESEETRESVLEGITIRNFWLLTCCPGGAGIYISHGDPTIRNCKIINCHVQLDACPCMTFGGGISVSRGSPLIEGCLIKGNSITGYGSGISCCDGLYPGSVLVYIKNCVIAENDSGTGAIYMYDYRDAYIQNCTIVNNQDYGVWCDYFEMSAYPTQVRECIFWANYPDQASGYPILSNLNYTPNLGPTTRPAPNFVAPANDDYHLQWDSPCIDFCQYGEYDPNEVEIDNEPRVMGVYADAGADEVGPKQADFSRNGHIGLEDFAYLSAAWQSVPADSNWYLLCDLYSDDMINFNDLELLADDWLWQAAWFDNEW